MSYRPLLLNGLANALKQHLDTSQKKNQNYSLRAFARDIQISPSTISKIMNEKYVVSDKLLNEIVEYLNLEIAVKRQIIFIERCRKLGDFFAVGRKGNLDENPLRFHKSIKVDSQMLGDVMRILKSINIGLLCGLETVSILKDSDTHYDMSIVVEISGNQ